MKMLRMMGMVSLLGGFTGLAGPSPIYENYGAVTNVPQVDAIAFANYGVFSVSSLLPYETQNTLYFTNRGFMVGNPGFRLENVSDGGVRQPANIFFNDTGATIRGEESFGVIIGGGGGGFVFSEQSQVLINAQTNINRGLLTVGANGRISTRGGSLQLARSGLEVRPISDEFNFPGICFLGGTPFLTHYQFLSRSRGL